MMEIIKMFEVGYKLKNGAVVLKSRTDETGMTTILAEWDQSHLHPYVTWRADKYGHCYLGHYFDELSKANEDFAERTTSAFNWRK